MAPSPSAESGSVHVPLLDTRISKPNRGSAAWYAGLGLMTALEVIEWPVALVVGASHAIATSASNAEVRQTAQGAETAS